MPIRIFTFCFQLLGITTKNNRKHYWEIYVPRDYRISRLCIRISDEKKVAALHFWDKELPSLDHRVALGSLLRGDFIIAVKDEVRVWVDKGNHQPEAPKPSEWGQVLDNKTYIENDLEVSKYSALKRTGTRVTALTSLISSFYCSRTFCVGYADGTMKFWNHTSDMQFVATKKCHEGRIFTLALSPDKKYIITGSSMGALNEPSDIKKWYAKSGGHLASSEPLRESLVSALAFTPDGQYVIVQGASTADVVKFVEFTEFKDMYYATDRFKLKSSIEIGTVIEEKQKSKSNLGQSPPSTDAEDVPISKSALDVSPDGKWICTTLDEPKMISVINIDEQNVCHTEAHGNYVLGGRFSPDGKYVATWSSALKNPMDPDDKTLDGASEVKLFHMTASGKLKMTAVYKLAKRETHFVKGDYDFPGMILYSSLFT